MNRFATSLISSLLGWLRSFFQELLYALNGSSSDSFLSWLSRYWFVAFLLLLLLGCAVDLIVYFLRWRPFLLGKPRREIPSASSYDDAFSQGGFQGGYTDGISGYSFNETGVADLYQQDELQTDASSNDNPVPQDQALPVQTEVPVRRYRSKIYSDSNT